MRKRLFIAIDIEEEHKVAIGQLQKQLKQDAEQLKVKDSDVNWVKPQQIHLTLKFLGDVEEDRIADVCDAVRRAAVENSRFEISIESAGFFGRRAATVVWVGISDQSSKLSKLYEAIEAELEAAGFEKEAREFSGHLTLGRVKHPKAGLKLAKIIEGYHDYKLGNLRPRAVVIYESKLTPQGPIYTMVESCKLKD